ncbi:unnamed protein product [Protopolystoma xenopodis]|uniref:Uncharacterized protein n=1 Tax=Protopolystoma xenopodis TaxID=117903 RepID=A0A448WML7_9PLAT|nr:unnamed protein product [Protopolystoma xenopodis]
MKRSRETIRACWYASAYYNVGYLCFLSKDRPPSVPHESTMTDGTPSKRAVELVEIACKADMQRNPQLGDQAPLTPLASNGALTVGSLSKTNQTEKQ